MAWCSLHRMVRLRVSRFQRSEAYPGFGQQRAVGASAPGAFRCGYQNGVVLLVSFEHRIEVGPVPRLSSSP